MNLKERLDEHDLEISKHDKQIKAMRDLVHEGFRLLVETRKDIRSLSASQKKTDAMLQELLASLKRGGNGHAKRKLEI